MSTKIYDVCALGELLIDFTENGTSSQGNPLMEANPGGAPCNVLAMLSKLGYKTTFIGKVGKDTFGRQLKDTLHQVGIDTTSLVEDPTANTTIAFVHTLPDGDREFSFYRNHSADVMLNESDIDTEVISNSKIFHFGSLSMTATRCEMATKKAIAIAKQSGAIVSFDPNLRENLWNSLDIARDKVEYGLTQCDVLKISDNEITWLTGENDFDKAVETLKSRYNIPLVCLTLGKYGSRAYSNSGYAFAPTNQVATIETTGAGDTFCGCILGKVLETGLKDFSSQELESMLYFANCSASIVTTRKGALKVMPSLDEIKALMNVR